MERKLAAILYADVVGYSRLTGADEEGTFRSLKDHFDAFANEIEKQGGRIVNTAGDAVLAEFASVVAALNCAVAVQREFAKRDEGVLDDRKLQFRIGVNLGDIIVDGDEIYGNGVNVAARLESLAEAGGICISGRVLEQVKGNVDVGFASLGLQSVKNIESPVNVYKVLLDPKDAGKTIDLQKSQPARWARVAAIGLVLFVAATIGFAIWQQPAETPTEVASDKEPILPLPAEPSIAVLAFENIGGEPKDEYFADGITEDVITELARHRELFVISRHSAFAYKGASPDVREVSRKLGVRYVLEGSVQRSGEYLRLTTQLIDARTGRHLWAERYDRDIEDIFAVQDELSHTVAALLLPHLRRAEETASVRKPTESLEAYDFLKRGIYYKHRLTPSSMEQARQALKKAIEIDPSLAEAYAYLAFNNAVAFALGYFNDPGLLDQALALCQRAITLDPDLPIAYQAMSQVLAFKGRYDAAAVAGQRAIELNPNDAENYIIYSRAASTAGHYAQALEASEKAMRLNPLAPIWYYFIHGRALYAAGQYEKAIEVLTEGINRSPYKPVRIHLIAALSRLDRRNQARDHVKALLQASPDYTLARAEKLLGFKEPEMNRRFLDDLHQAGIPGHVTDARASRQQ